MPDLPLLEQSSAMDRMVTANSGETISSISWEQPVMLVFLRHFGCSFCRESISDIAARRKNIEARGIRIVLVHMAVHPDAAEAFFRKFKLYPVDHISDPEKRFYEAFGLVRCSPAQLIGFMNWVRGFQAGILAGHGFARETEELGDGFQMPGVFILHKGEIKYAYRHQAPYDRPDYEALVGCCGW